MKLYRRSFLAGCVALALCGTAYANFLPGWYPGGAAVNTRGPVTEMAFHDSSLSTAQTVSVPAGLAPGDLLVLADLALSANVVPTDFTQITTSVVNSLRLTTSFKLAVGTETTISGMTGSGAVSKILVVFKPNGAVTSYAVAGALQDGTTGNPGEQTVTSSGGTPPFIVFGFWGANGTVNPRAMTPAKDSEIDQDWDSNLDALWIAWKHYNTGSTPANVAVDMGDHGNANNLQSGYITAVP